MRWYVIRLLPGFGQRNVALINLQRQDFETYSPLGTIERMSGKKLIRETRPVFDGYLFVRTAMTPAAQRSINSTRGVLRLLSPAPLQPPTPVPDGEIEAIQHKERTGKLLLSTAKRFRKGDLLRFKNGPLADRLCSCAWSNGERVILLLDLLSGTYRISAPAHTLALVGRTAVR